MDLGQYQNSIPALNQLNNNRYERIFKMFTTDNNQYYYNLIQSIYLPNNIDDSKVYYLTVKQNIPWTMISFNAYGSIELWWLIMLTNKIYNPLVNPANGQVLKIIKPEYIPVILNEITNNLVH
jgi:hypothetical protein